MLITGGTYALVGIKNRWIHTFFSTAYTGALGIAVLIVYVMNVPVGNALQGGYVAAVVLSGCAFGAASVFFKELTEGLGCALGGFCISMWLLCLTPGGLLKPVPSKAIFIACFTLVAFAFYFSRYTRDWALISMISFAGATIVVLGIDCFSRAGLKEFWAYVWDLNDNLFPLGADTYPVTKGIRVETAAIVIIFLVGIISQIKLWRIVREKREKRAADRAEGQRNLEQEEEDVGRQVEASTARERREWERIYGDQDAGNSTLSDTGSEKRLRQSFNESAKQQSEAEAYEMTDMSDSDRGRPRADPMEKDQEGRVTVRVAADDVPEAQTELDDDFDEKKGDAPKSNRHSTREPTEKQRLSSARSAAEAPEVVPLPFVVPNEQDDDTRSHGDRSSVATFADDDQGQVEAPQRRHSFARRLSHGSSRLLRSLSQRSARARHPSSPDAGESTEDLVIPRARQDDESSIAATLDGESLVDSDRRSILDGVGSPQKEVTLNISDKELKEPKDESTSDKEAGDEILRSQQPAGASAKGMEETQARRLSSDVRDDTNMVTKENLEGTEASQPDQSARPKSLASASSTPASLTKDRLPRSLSKVAMSYRTNEWAKHLSYADAPGPEELNIETPKDTKRKSLKERPVPVKIDELQQGIEDGAPGPAIVRSDSRLSNASLNVAMPKRQSRQNAAPSIASSPDTDRPFSPPLMPTNPNMVRSASSAAVRRQSATFEPIVEEHDAANNPVAMREEGDLLRPMSASPPLSTSPALGHRQAVPGLVSYSSPQTLLGQREMFLRSRSSGNLLANLPEEIDPSTQHPGSDAGSLYNYPIYAAALAADPDDIPLSQRKEMMRHSSLTSLQGQNSMPLHRASSGMDLAERRNFDSHQPKRNSTLPTTMAREAQLAHFRNSVATDLRSGTPMMASTTRETQFSSTTNLLTSASGREAEVRRNIELQRHRMLGQKEAEAQRKEMDRQQKEWTDRAFDERMRSGELMDAHREAMRRMQQAAKDKPNP